MSNIDERTLITSWYSGIYPTRSYCANIIEDDVMFLRTAIENGTIIIPTLIDKNITFPDKPVYLPIHKLPTCTTFKTKLAILRNLIRGHYRSRITQLKFGDIVFYYNKGVILNDALVPLCIAACKYTVPENNPASYRYTNQTHLMYINPDVFRVSNNLNKLIINSILPTFLEQYHDGEVLIRHPKELYVKPTYQDDLGEPLYQQVLLERTANIRDTIDSASAGNDSQILIP